jgi:hypothetical protein
MTPLIRSCPFLCDLCDFRVDGLFGSDLHTEIAKVAKTNSDLDGPSIRDCPFLWDLCDLRVDGLFSSDLHTEIAKTNSD